MAEMRDVIDEARIILQDLPKIRYSDPDLLKAANYALFEARRLRPDLFLGSLTTDQDELGLDAPFPLPAAFQPLVSNYIAGRAELRDDEFAVEGRAATLFTWFRTQLITV